MKRNTAGFTIIELMIASAIFSVVLILCVTALLQIGRMYYKGVTSSRTQEAARTILDEISQAIQFSSGQVTTPSIGNPYRFCIDNKRYSVYTGKKLVDGVPDADQAKHVLVSDDAPGCPVTAQNLNNAAVILTPGSRELLPAGMRISKLTIGEDSLTGLYTITVRVVSGDGDLLTNPADAPDASCAVSTRSGGQFCAMSELTTTVKKRL